jgi:hypothetical protein
VLGIYQCPAGYTWQQFVDSAYNIDNKFTIGPGTPTGVYYDNNAQPLLP